MSLLSGPGSLLVSGAGLAGPTSQDSVVVASPLPGGVAAVVRFLLGLPAWFQIAGFFVGLAVAGVVLFLLWRRRLAIRTWIVTRPHRLRLGLAVAAGVLIVGAAGFGAVSWNYMQHDNGFCTGCHVMGPAYVRFTQSEHSTLSCHACHQQSIVASMRQMYLWVAERPSEIGPHAKVPNAVCARCHVTGEREVWQRIASTAGHRTHLESGDPALGNVQCVTCHAVEVHRFAPLDQTCAQAGCHDVSRIALGKMRGQTALHCTACHRFTAEVPTLATRDSAAGTLVPGERQCFSCHEMRERIAGMNLDPSRDPHRGTCGMCHNPHVQERPAEAKQTCTTAQCHADWRSEPFHVGLQHRSAGQQCTLCHLPHQAKVDASDCAGCHEMVRQRARGITPPLPFDTTKALRRVSWWGGERQLHGKGDGVYVDDPPLLHAFAFPVSRFPLPAALPDTFPHNRHQSLACLTCHVARSGHGRLTFVPPRGCQICHHQAPATSDCAKCHTTAAIAPAESVTVRVAVAGALPRGHPVAFAHQTHRSLKCVQCHTTPVSLAPEAPVAACASCHDDHHTAARRCAACHTETTPEIQTAHAPPVEGHTACDACHIREIVARLVPDRAMCVTCHAKEQDHYAARECTVCHFQAEPEAYRRHLSKAGGA